MPDVARYKFEPVEDCRGSDLEVGVGEWSALLLEMSLDLTKYPSGRRVVWQDGHCWQDAFLDILKMTVARLRAVSALVQLTDGHSTGKLILA